VNLHSENLMMIPMPRKI